MHGVTRDSILTLAAAQGLSVTERDLSIEDLINLASNPDAEAALSGTAAILAPVGTLIYQGREYPLGEGKAGPRVAAMRAALNDIQWGKAPDTHGWLSEV